MEIKKIAAHYRQYLARMIKQSTRADYTKRLEMLVHYASMHGITTIEDIEFSQFLEWVFIDRGVAPRTHNNYRTWCLSFCKWLRQQHYIAADPLLDVPPLKEPPKVRQPLPPSELKRVRDYLSERNKHFLLAVMMEYYCFIRPDELSNIRIGDIDAKAHAIYVRAEISKNGKAEMVGLNNAVLSLMRELHVLRSPKDWFLFSVRCRPGATKLHSRMFRDRWARLRKRLDLPKEYQFYSLKDSGIRDLANAEGIVIARDQARHSSEHLQGSGNVRDYDGWRSLYTYRDDAGDHGNLTNSDYWQREVAGASDTQPMWDSETAYDYGDVVRYTQGSTTYKCTSLSNNNTEAPFKSGGAPNVGIAWQETTYDDTAPDFDESVLNGDGYAYGATVNITEISSVFGKRTIKSLRGGDTNGNKVYPYTKVDYKPEDANGNSIVGKKYPMQNWCINFYVRLENE